MNVNIGTLNKKIEIYNADDDLIMIRWAAVNQISGTEMIKNNVQFEQTNARFLIRYTKTPIKSDYYIKFNGSSYDIQYTNDYNFAHEFIEIIATKRAYDEV